jgi:thiamine biosynthesis lipoprotein
MTPALHEIHLTGTAQGTTFHITYFAGDTLVKASQVDSIFRKIDSSLSIYKPASLISRFNNATDGIEMDDHLLQVVRTSLEIYKNTRGISDITVYPLVRAWGFGPSPATSLPDSATIKGILPCEGADKLIIDHDRLRKTKPCVKIYLNGIAQGYTVDVIADFFEKNNVQDYLVEVGGELRVKGHKHPGNKLFQVGIESPAANNFGEPVIKKAMQVEKGAITTSGNYRKYFERGGKIFSHLMDPVTGYPIQNEMISVTLYAEKAITADGYDNALMGMGLAGAFEFLKEHPELQAYFIYHTRNGSVADTATAGFYKLITE